MLLRRLFLCLVFLLPFTLIHAADPVALHENDITFIKKATSAGMMEVRSCEVAQKRALTAEEEAFTKQLISDHEKANNELESIAKRKGVATPSSLTADEQAKLTKMGELKDKDFNAKFLKHQVSCHKEAVELFEDEAKNGKDPDLTAFAAKTLPTLKAHLETAKRLEAKY